MQLEVHGSSDVTHAARTVMEGAGVRSALPGPRAGTIAVEYYVDKSGPQQLAQALQRQGVRAQVRRNALRARCRHNCNAACRCLLHTKPCVRRRSVMSTHTALHMHHGFAAAMDLPRGYVRLQVAPAAAQPAIVRLRVTGMTCGACSASVTKMLLKVRTAW